MIAIPPDCLPVRHAYEKHLRDQDSLSIKILAGTENMAHPDLEDLDISWLQAKVKVNLNTP
jgi:hypothetical protein